MCKVDTSLKYGSLEDNFFSVTDQMKYMQLGSLSALIYVCLILLLHVHGYQRERMLAGWICYGRKLKVTLMRIPRNHILPYAIDRISRMRRSIYWN